MSKCRVAISQDFQGSDGSPVFPSIDLSPLDDPRIDWSIIPVQNGRIDAADLDGYDALILLSARFDADSIPTDGRLALVARFGVGYGHRRYRRLHGKRRCPLSSRPMV